MSRAFTVLTPLEARIVRALGQTMYPREGGIPIDAEQARAVEYVDAWLAALPAKERTLVRLMFVLFEVAMPVFGPSRLRVFSLAKAQHRHAYLSSWENSQFYFRRASMFALRSVFALAYLADEDVLSSIGIEDGVEILARHRAERAGGPADLRGADIDSSANVAVLRDAVDTVRSLDEKRREKKARSAVGGGDI